MKLVFAHNVYNRTNTLKNTIDIEKNNYNNVNFYVAYNGNIDLNKFNDDTIKFKFFTPKTHKAGCVNGFLTSLQMSLETKFDVLVFSHDDIYLNNIDVFNKNIELILNGYDVVIRKPINLQDKNYYMMETVFLSYDMVKKISEEKLIFDDNDMPTDYKKSPSPEILLYNIIKNYTNKIYEIEYIHDDETYNAILQCTLGVYHKMAGIRGWVD